MKTKFLEHKENLVMGVIRNYPMEIILGVVIVFLIFMAPGFASTNNVLNVLRTVSTLGIIAFGMTAVIISGEIDLSVGAGVALAGCIVAWFAGAIGGWGGVAVGGAGRWFCRICCWLSHGAIPPLV